MQQSDPRGAGPPAHRLSLHTAVLEAVSLGQMEPVSARFQTASLPRVPQSRGLGLDGRVAYAFTSHLQCFQQLTCKP